MNKKIIALAVAAAFTAPMAAQAELKTYGQAQVEFGSHGGDTGVGESVADNARGRIGFKSTEDLGNGLKAMAKFEFKVDTADGDAGKCATTVTDTNGDTPATVSDDKISCKADVSLQKREMMIGLKGGFGEVQFGRLKTAYKYTGGVKYDGYTASNLEARGLVMSGKVGKGAIGNAAGHNGFVSDSLAYKVKSGAISFWLTYDMDTGGSASDTGGNAMTASVKYKAKNWEAFVAVADDDNDGAAGDSYSSTKFGGQYKVGAHKISLQIEGADANGTDVDYMYVNYDMKMGKNTFTASIGTQETDGAPGADLDFTRLALKHKFSKKTSAWIGFVAVGVDAAGNDEDVTSLGMRVDF